MKSCSPLADMHRTAPPPPARGRINCKTSPAAISHLQSHTRRQRGPSIINVTYSCTSPLYRHGVELAARDFTAATLPSYIDALPRALAHQIEADPEQYDALTQAWTEAVTRGLDPREAWEEVTEKLDTANKPGTVIAHRLRLVTRESIEGTETTETTETKALPTPPPAAPGTSAELSTWLADTRRTLTDAAEGAPAAAATEEAANDFVASYLAHRATERENGPDAATTSGPQSEWGPTTDSSPDLW